ncbi:MAG TPA: cytidine deaminase [Lactovum miscens]|uniref:cytidine deaminase n=1 Tax=Lactovum miscens TaxID=190387 RepID=UPI002EDAA641
MFDKAIAKLAKEASMLAYTPYSHFPVGAALVTSEKEIIQGCNIENASFGLSNCAERTAVFKAISSGYRNFDAIYIYGDTKEPISPCGACRQVLAEFCEEEMPVYLLSKDLEVKETTIAGLLPYHFKRSNLSTNV